MNHTSARLLKILHILVNGSYHCDRLLQRFLHEELDEESSFLIMFNTEFGRFKFTIILFAMNVAGDVFQYRLDKIFGKVTWLQRRLQQL